jgi:hypothetical protein
MFFLLFRDTSPFSKDGMSGCAFNAPHLTGIYKNGCPSAAQKWPQG